MPAHGYLFPPAVGRVATPAPPGLPVSSTNLSLGQSHRSQSMPKQKVTSLGQSHRSEVSPKQRLPPLGKPRSQVCQQGYLLGKATAHRVCQSMPKQKVTSLEPKPPLTEYAETKGYLPLGTATAHKKQRLPPLADHRSQVWVRLPPLGKATAHRVCRNKRLPPLGKATAHRVCRNKRLPPLGKATAHRVCRNKGLPPAASPARSMPNKRCLPAASHRSRVCRTKVPPAASPPVCRNKRLPPCGKATAHRYAETKVTSLRQSHR